jgi:low affinity Fe/Cu permease
VDPIQFYISVAVVPVTTIIIVLIGVLLNNGNMNRRMDDLNRRFDDLRTEVLRLLEAHSARHEANLRRVEEVIDARLSRIEEHLHLK